MKEQLFLSVKCVISKATERTALPFTWALNIEISNSWMKQLRGKIRFLSVKCVISKPKERTTLPFTWTLIIEESGDRDRDSDVTLTAS